MKGRLREPSGGSSGLRAPGEAGGGGRLSRATASVPLPRPSLCDGPAPARRGSCRSHRGPGLPAAGLSAAHSAVRPAPHKATGRGCGMLGGEPERELAGLGVGVACWAPATPPGPGGPMCLHADPGALASPLLLLTSVILRAQPAAHQGPRRVRTRPRPSASAFRDRALNAHGRAPVGSAELGTDTGPGLSLHEPGQVPGPPAPPGLRLPFVRRVLGSLYGFQRPLCSKMRDGDQVASFSQSRCVHLTPAPLPGGVSAKVNSWPPQVVPQV